MNSKVRIIKGGTRANPNNVGDTIQKTERELERETAGTVKTWISEWEVRKRSLRKSAIALINSLEQRSQSPA